MASNDLEVLDPVTPVEKVMESKSGSEIDRRYFFAAMGVAGVAAGAALFSGKSAEAQQPSPNGFAQVDVINFLLNLKYLKGTIYSYATQGVDLPASTYVTLGTGAVYNPLAKVNFGTNTQMADIFNEMYYDELNQLIALRKAQGVAVAPRQSMNLLGTGPSGAAPTSATTTLTPAQLISLTRMLEDLSASAFAAATVYLTGTNLALAAQALATDSQHASMLRLLAIQNGVPYQGTQYASVATSNTAQTPVNFTGVTQAGNAVIQANIGANIPAAGSIVTGVGIPPGAGAVIQSVTNLAAITFTAIPDKTTILKDVSSVAGLSIGQPLTGTYIPSGGYITGIGTNTVTLSAATTTAATTGPTGYVTSGSPTITGVSSTTGLIVGQPITGTGIPTTPTATTITAFSGAAGSATITLSANATATSLVNATGTVTSGSPTITNLSTVSGFVVGQTISGTGIPAGTTIVALPTSNTLTMSANGSATTGTATTAFSGIVTSGSAAITLVPSTTGLAVGQLLSGTGIPVGATIKTISGTTVTSSASATASSTTSVTAVITQGSNVLTSVPSVVGLNVGQPVTGTGIAASSVITIIGTNTVTLNNPATLSFPSGGSFSSPVAEPVFAGGEAITSPTTETVTSGIIQTYTISQNQITLAGPTTVTGFNTFYIVVPDNEDVEPGDPGIPGSPAPSVPVSAATAALGPQPIVGNPALNPPLNPPVYQAFFNTAGAGTTGSTSTPPGFAFAKTFQQVLAVLYGYNATNSIISTQNYEGGFFPVGVSGPINSAT